MEYKNILNEIFGKKFADKMAEYQPRQLYECLPEVEEKLTKLELKKLRAMKDFFTAAVACPIRRGDRYLSSEDVFKSFREMFLTMDRETFIVLPLDSKNKLIENPITISVGSMISTVVHPAMVLKALIKANAISAIIIHNHPSSGDPEPSSEDIELSTRLKKLGEMLGVKFLDHIIMGDGRYVSFTDRRLW